jgi:tetratricopeptide (TPR) repeat protein
VPFGARASLMAAVERALARTEPTAPHDAVTDAAAEHRHASPSRLRRQLAGDLGIIMRKAVAADPVGRYASVEHLAEDLDRWTRGDPVLGRAPSLAYRASRFVARHRIAVGIAAMLLVSLLAATVVSLQQAAIARRQEAITREQVEIAETESGKAHQLNRFLTRMLSSANPSWYNTSASSAGSITVREVLDGASDLVATELGKTPAVEAEMRRTLGRTYIGLGDATRARTQLDRALALYREQGDAFGVAFTRALLGEHGLLIGDYKAAETELRAALAYVRSLGGVPTDPELHMMATNDLGVAISIQSPGHPEAIELKKEGIAVGDRSGASAAGAAIGVANLGLDFMSAGRLDEAETTMRDALHRMDALPTSPPERYGALNNLSHVLRTKGHYAEAERLGAAAVVGARDVWGPTHYRYAAHATTWGRALIGLGRLEEARTVLLQAREVYRKTRPDDHVDLLATLLGLGAIHRQQARLADAERVLRNARAIALKNPAVKDRGAEVAGELGLTLRALGKPAEAEALLKESHDILQAAFGDAHPLTEQALARMRGGNSASATR